MTELEESALHYEGLVGGLGIRFIVEVERATGLLSDHAEIGQELEQGLRLFVLADFPHSLIYSIESKHIWGVAVAHHKRRPGYWRDRIAR